MIKKIEYSLNAIYYSLWLINIRFDKRLSSFVDDITDFLLSHLSTKEYKNAFIRNREKRKQEFDKNAFNLSDGYHINWANHFYGIACSCYPTLISFIILGLLLRIDPMIKDFVYLIIFIIPIGICYTFAYHAVYSQNKYHRYFEQFEKEDARWHKKWKKITITYCIIAQLVFVLGVITTLLIATH